MSTPKPCFLTSDRLKVSMCENLYKNQWQGIGNISVTKLHWFKRHKSIKSSGNTEQIKPKGCRSDFKDEVWPVASFTHFFM